nr:MAG TPA: hypothetical protein [Bacteriophage sp.]
MIHRFITYISNASNKVCVYFCVIIFIEWKFCPKTSYKIRCSKICRRTIRRVFLQ